MGTSTLFVILLVSTIISPSLSFLVRSSGNFGLQPSAAYPARQAERLTGALNHAPKDLTNTASDTAGTVSTDPAGRIVERRVAFPGLVSSSDGAVSVEELGHHAGYYSLPHSHAARMFYFFFESRGSKKDPVVIWLSGGPGCGSEFALFYENGPFSLSDNFTLLWNEFGWDKLSNIIYIDSPIGSGFSYTSDKRDIRRDEEGVSGDLYDFLQAFFMEHPEYAENDFYITGESYAGHFVPALASRVHQGNKAKEGIHINLKGLAISSGFTDPEIQYKALIDYALDMGIIQESDYERINKIYPACEIAIKLCGTSGTDSCVASYDFCETILTSIKEIAVGINVFDIRKPCESGGLCYDTAHMEKFLNQKSVRDTLGVGDIEYVTCRFSVRKAMLADNMINGAVGIPALLEDGIKLLIFVGEYDLLCNWLGNYRWVKSMEWSGQKEFLSSPETPFIVDGADAGVLKSQGPLSFVKVYDAAHTVPMDQPKVAVEMLGRWIKGELAEFSSEPKILTAQT